MRCSGCSLRVRPVVALDIDGTLGDYHSHFIEFAADWLGGRYVPRELLVYDGSEPFRDWFMRTFETDLSTFRSIKLAYRQGGLKRSMPPYPGAGELVALLRRHAEVWLTTTRPWERFDRIDPDTREWLRREGIEFDGLLYHEDKMEQLAERIDRQRVVAVLDDEEDNLIDAGALGWTPILRRMEYNRNLTWTGIAVQDLASAGKLIKEYIEEWERHNG